MKSLDLLAGGIMTATILLIAHYVLGSSGNTNPIKWQEHFLGFWIGMSMTLGNAYLFSKYRHLAERMN